MVPECAPCVRLGAGGLKKMGRSGSRLQSTLVDSLDCEAPIMVLLKRLLEAELLIILEVFSVEYEQLLNAMVMVGMIVDVSAFR
jgi:hypothetical protein